MILISDPLHNKECHQYILHFAKERNIELKVIDAKNTLNFFKPLSEKTLLYRISITKEARLLEQALLSGKTVSFRETPDAIFNTQNKFHQYVCFSKANIPTAKTIYSQNTEQKN